MQLIQRFLIAAAVDVHKHKNFGVFYNHILKQRVGEQESDEQTQTASATVKDEPPESDNEYDDTDDPILKRELEEDEDEEEENEEIGRNEENEKLSTFHKRSREKSSAKKKAYRSRREDSVSPERNIPTTNRDDSSDSDSSEDEEILNSSSKIGGKEKNQNKIQSETGETKKISEPKRTLVKDMPMDQRIARYELIFARRTKGDVFQNAVQRYFERKANQKLLSRSE